MNKKSMIVLGLVILLSSLGIKTALADVSLASTDVSYTASRSVSYAGAFNEISFEVNATLQCATTYSCSPSGVPPSSSTCHLSVTPNSALLTIDYHIKRYLQSDLNGTKPIQLSIEQLSGLVGNSPSPIVIPVDSAGTIAIVIHGKLIGQNLTVTPQGSANPNAVQWLDWTTQDTVISSANSRVTLEMDTAYEVSFAVTVLIPPFAEVSQDSLLQQCSGNVPPTFVIPEFPSLIMLTIFMLATLLAVTVYKRRPITRQEELG